MNLFSYSTKVKYSARLDGTRKYEKSTSVIIKAPKIDPILRTIGRLIAHLLRLYRTLRSKFSS